MDIQYVKRLWFLLALRNVRHISLQKSRGLPKTSQTLTLKAIKAMNSSNTIGYIMHSRRHQRAHTMILQNIAYAASQFSST